ncbi:MAG: hypothetical protein NC311_20355 [Muribaculaceae bacterium]|nr:hypothetical protein [Muribaculaceae bacterium]
MSFFLTVSLTRKKFTVKYYREDDNLERLIPVRGYVWPAPLAVYIKDQEVNVGHQAFKYYEQNVSGAFFDLFSLLRNEQVFTFYSETRNAREALFLGMEHVFREFASETGFVNTDDIKSSRHDIPLMIEFTPDITDEERNYVMTLFRDGHNGNCGGYTNLCEVDSNRYLADRLLEADFRNQVLVLSSDGVDLSMSLYGKSGVSKDCIAHTIEPDKGADPRINRLIDTLCEQISLQNSFIDKAVLMPQLRDIANDFIDNNRYEIQGQVVVNNYPYDYFITRGDCNINSSMAASSMINRIRNFVSKAGVDINDTIIALRGKEIQNEFFISNFRGNFEKVVLVDDKVVESVQSDIIRYARKRNYVFSDEVNHSVNRIDSLRNDFIEVASTIRQVLIPQKEFRKAKSELFCCRDIIEKEGFLAEFKENINRLLSEINNAEIDAVPPVTPRVEPERPVTSPVHDEPRVTSDPLQSAIMNRDFKSAKKIFNDREDYDNAVKMGQLDKMNHKFEVASRRVDDFKSEGNTIGIKRCISELTEYVSMLEEIGLPHTDVDNLLAKFKS